MTSKAVEKIKDQVNLVHLVEKHALKVHLTGGEFQQAQGILVVFSPEELHKFTEEIIQVAIANLGKALVEL